MAINKIKVGNVEHELQTTIPNIDGLEEELNDINNKIPTQTSQLTNDKNFASVQIVTWEADD